MLIQKYVHSNFCDRCEILNIRANVSPHKNFNLLLVLLREINHELPNNKEELAKMKHEVKKVKIIKLFKKSLKGLKVC